MTLRQPSDRTIRADALRVGDEVILTVMGGTEWVTVTRITRAGEHVRWRGYSSVMGEVSDVLHPEHAVRIAA